MKAAQATPHAELIAELMNPNNPKNEREHAAAREIERLREAIAQPVQPAAQAEPVAWWIPKAQHFCMPPKDGNRPSAKQWEPLYTTPTPQRQPLTDEQTKEIANSCRWSSTYHTDFARAIEAAHGIGAKP